MDQFNNRVPNNFVDAYGHPMTSDEKVIIVNKVIVVVVLHVTYTLFIIFKHVWPHVLVLVHLVYYFNVCVCMCI